MRGLVVLHTNDVHGRIEGLARVATLVERIRAERADAAVLYVDAGDVEERTVRISNLTKGVAMHRLLAAAGCDAAAVGHAAWLRYGAEVLPEQAAAVPYPLLLANLRRIGGAPLDGVRESLLLERDGVRVGLIGVTDPWHDLESHDLEAVPAGPLVRRLAGELRSRGADAVVLLSHLGPDADRDLAAELHREVDVVLGAHAHDMAPASASVDGVLLAHAGEHAQYLGCVEIGRDGASGTALSVDSSIPPHPAVLAEAAAIEPELASFLGVVLGRLPEPLDFAVDRECGTAAWTADVLRRRMAAEVGIVAAGQAFTGPLPEGDLTRGTLWEVCESTANPGVTTMRGAQLQEIVGRGRDPAFAASTDPSLRGRPRGLLHVSGAEVHDGSIVVDGRPLSRDREYVVAGTDWELEPYGGYVDPDWGLRVRYDLPTIVRDALEEELATGAAWPVR
jgi:5'-nucleotidase